MSLYLWAAAFVVMLGVVLIATDNFISGLLVVIIGLIASIIVYRRRAKGGY